MAVRTATVAAMAAAGFAGIEIVLATAAVAAPKPSTPPTPVAASPTSTRAPQAPSRSATPRPSVVPTRSGSYVPPPAPRSSAPIGVPAGGGVASGADVGSSALVITLLASGVALAGGGAVLAVRRRS